jgi:hypothetical protein
MHINKSLVRGQNQTHILINYLFGGSCLLLALGAFSMESSFVVGMDHSFLIKNLLIIKTPMMDGGDYIQFFSHVAILVLS